MIEDTNAHLNQSYIIYAILNSDFDYGVNMLLKYQDLLRNINFIMADPKNYGCDYWKPFKKLNLKNINFNNIFSQERLFCFNVDFIKDTLRKKEKPLHIESVVSLDTQIQSYLYRKYKNEITTIPKNIDEIIKLTHKRKWGVDCMSYTFENTLFNNEFFNNPMYFENMYSFEMFFIKNPIKAKIYSERLIEMNKKLITGEMSNWYKRVYKCYYLNLLVMVDIKLNKSNLSILEKEKEFVDFFHKEISLISDREVNLAKLYFQYGTKIGFFSKIQRGNKNIVKNLKNMAWDIFHIHNTINNVTIQSQQLADFTIPFFVTYDKRLNDILPVFQLKCIAYEKNTTKKWPIYEMNIIDPIIENKYLTLIAGKERIDKLKKLNVNEQKLIKIIDKHILSLERKLNNN